MVRLIQSAKNSTDFLTGENHRDTPRLLRTNHAINIFKRFFNLESAVERFVECVEFCDWQGAMRSNSLPIATIRNAARHKRQRAIQAVATHPADELSISREHDIHQQVNTFSKRSTAESSVVS